MLTLHSVHFDNYIPNWRNNLAVISQNVLALIVDGKIKYTLNDQTFIAEKGELLFIPAGTLRASENADGEHQKITVLFKHDDDSAKELPFLGKNRFDKCKIRSFEYMKRRFERLYLETVGDVKFHQFVVSGIFHELIGMAAREFELVEVTPIKLKLANELQKYLVAHFRQPIQIEQLAALVHRSANYTISLFREVMGISPIQYVHLLRVKEACNLLTNSDLTVTEISDYLGYYDHSYFFRIFKKYMFMSPTEYRLAGSQSPHLL
ncbi:hypothetical protein SD70_07670 [Gordoniibacillus kamchatkensis]|uniref:HTH araC/xylS-type domain-containing protein n=1 Tax=Gordoniibacillus kamchatkensis TaxID=1590651 RepID=A0ABR5AJT9_9BACL|nr:AraC family transcriptional regulator [Paenibacillus sp. VKM B-2647]KIL41325.1 hypothetical protein SD70_07670 [Paenibacillus sp. VKM B-2647]